VTSSCAGKIGLREPGEHTSGPNLASRDNVAHNPTLYTILETPPPVHPALSKAGSDIQMVTCWLACLECWRSLAAVERVLPQQGPNEEAAEGGFKMKLPRRNFLHLAAGAAALPAVSRFAFAQAYPSRPVRIVVGFAPGGASRLV
jgi:hypothetical protein